MTENSSGLSVSGAGNSSANRAASGGTRVEPSPAQPSTSALIIGQATAVLAVATAVVYGAGGLSLGLRLWYDQYSWAPVVGQLPRSFLLVDAIEVIVPAISVGVLIYLLYMRSEGFWDGLNARPIAPWLWSLALSLVLAAVPLLFLHFVRKTTIHGVIRPYWQIFVLCGILNLVFIRLAIYLLPKTNIKGLREILGIGVLSLMLIPVSASAAASYAFPIVKLCGTSFARSDRHGHDYAIGNLVGSNGQWAYVAETLALSPKPNKYVFLGGYIAIIPLSEVQLEGIGRDASCGDLHASVARTP